jgi:hypothetical protein
MFVLNTNSPEYNFAGTRVRMLLSGKQTSEAFCMMEMFSLARVRHCTLTQGKRKRLPSSRVCSM